MLDRLIATGAFAGELLERTSSTARVQAIVETSLTPVFMLAAIGAVLNVINMRMVWVVERAERIEQLSESGAETRDVEELPALRRRIRHGSRAISLSTAAALMICGIIALGFVSAFVSTPLGTVVAVMWIATMAMIFAALLYFLLETNIAAKTRRERRQIARRITAREDDADSAVSASAETADHR